MKILNINNNPYIPVITNTQKTSTATNSSGLNSAEINKNTITVAPAKSIVEKIDTIVDKNKNPIEAYSSVEPLICGTGYKAAIKDSKGKTLGYALYNETKQDPLIVQKEKEYLKNGALSINMLISLKGKDYSNIGTTLEKIIAQQSINKGYEGRVVLRAKWNSHCFHYKNGFIPLEKGACLNSIEDTKSFLKNALELYKKTGIKSNSYGLGNIVMALSKDGLKNLLSQ